MSEEWPPERLEATRGRYCRVLVANHDVLEARAYLRVLRDAAPPADRLSVISAGLLTAFVISYGRCFTMSEWAPARKAVLLPEGAIKAFDGDEKLLHARLVALRMQEFAHSDVTAADIAVSADTPDTLVPSSRVMRHYSLTASDLSVASSMMDKLVVYITHELIRLQEELAPFGPWQPPSPSAAA